MKTIERILKNAPGVDAYRITEGATQSYELFFVHKSLETVRATDTVATSVTVYVDHDGKKGDSTFTVYRSMSEADMEKAVAAAVARARLVFNEPYDLPEAGEISAELPTNMKGADMQALGAQIADAVFAADTVEGGSINACEIFLYRDTLHVINSNGVDKTQVTHRVMIEAIPTFTDDNQSVELYEDYRFTVFDAKAVTAEIARRMQEVRDRANAVRPQTPLTVNVLLRPDEIQRMIGGLARDLSYATVYNHGNLHKIGDDLQSGGSGDKLTVTMKAITEGSERSAFFDEDGTALNDTMVLENGIVKSYHGDSRFGQYLGIEKPSGILRCMKVAPGTLTEEEIKSAPYVECASLSGLQLDLYADYIGGEIRLAYYFDGEKTVPITGITMSAKLSEVLAGLKLADKTCVDGAYEGPVLVMMKNVAIL